MSALAQCPVPKLLDSHLTGQRYNTATVLLIEMYLTGNHYAQLALTPSGMQPASR